MWWKYGNVAAMVQIIEIIEADGFLHIYEDNTEASYSAGRKRPPMGSHQRRSPMW